MVIKLWLVLAPRLSPRRHESGRQHYKRFIPFIK